MNNACSAGPATAAVIRKQIKATDVARSSAEMGPSNNTCGGGASKKEPVLYSLPRRARLVGFRCRVISTSNAARKRTNNPFLLPSPAPEEQTNNREEAGDGTGTVSWGGKRRGKGKG